mmetsp:Transcript_42173/g.120639  ORF Transcript_42173/g.120639 Transcript_42173/m.120639 type:complete len:358 (+) Transcript_42173:329-1402(+)
MPRLLGGPAGDLEDAEDGADLRVAREKRFAHRHLGDDAADGPNVNLRSVLLDSEHDLRASVPQGDDIVRVACPRGRGEQAGQAEVAYLQSGRAHQDVLGLEVAVQNQPCVAGVEPVEQVKAVVHQLLHRHEMAGSAVVFQDPVEVVVDVLKHQVVLRHADNLQVDEAHDVGVREVAQDGYLAHNDRGHSIAIVVELQLLDRDCLPSRPVNRLVDSAEDTRAEKLSPVILLCEILFISIPASADQLRRGPLRRSHVVMVGLPARTILSRILGHVRLRRPHSFFAIDHFLEHALLPGGHRSRGSIDQGVALSLICLLTLCRSRLFLRSRFKQNTLWRSCLRDLHVKSMKARVDQLRSGR